MKLFTFLTSLFISRYQFKTHKSDIAFLIGSDKQNMNEQYPEKNIYVRGTVRTLRLTFCRHNQPAEWVNRATLNWLYTRFMYIRLELCNRWSEFRPSSSSSLQFNSLFYATPERVIFFFYKKPLFYVRITLGGPLPWAIAMRKINFLNFLYFLNVFRTRTLTLFFRMAVRITNYPAIAAGLHHV